MTSALIERHQRITKGVAAQITPERMQIAALALFEPVGPFHLIFGYWLALIALAASAPRVSLLYVGTIAYLPP